MVIYTKESAGCALFGLMRCTIRYSFLLPLPPYIAILQAKQHATQNKQGLGRSDVPKLAAGARWCGSKTKIGSDNGSGEEEEGGSLKGCRVSGRGYTSVWHCISIPNLTTYAQFLWVRLS